MNLASLALRLSCARGARPRLAGERLSTPPPTGAASGCEHERRSKGELFEGRGRTGLRHPGRPPVPCPRPAGRTGQRDRRVAPPLARCQAARPARRAFDGASSGGGGREPTLGRPARLCPRVGHRDRPRKALRAGAGPRRPRSRNDRQLARDPETTVRIGRFRIGRAAGPRRPRTTVRSRPGPDPSVRGPVSARRP